MSRLAKGLVTFILVLCVGKGIASVHSPLQNKNEFKVELFRTTETNGLLTSDLRVNGDPIGQCFEHPKKKIPTGTYRGIVRTISMKGFVQGPGGVLANTGDFLLEVANVPGRTDILFHAGNKTEHTEGCILCGPSTKLGDKKIAPETLRILRTKFFGTDTPKENPNTTISIIVYEK